MRIKLDFPEKVVFTTEIAVRISDVNYGGHLGNDAVLSLAHEARLQFLKSINCTELNLFCVSIIMGDAAVVYKAEAFYGDVLQIQIAIADVSARSFDIYYSLKNKKTQQQIAIVKTGIVCFDYETRKTTNVPTEFVNLFA
ncbi:MAG: thioesterase family protein [Bacteroidota bacterium]